MRVIDLLEKKGREVHTVSPDRTVAEAVAALRSEAVRALIVTAEERVVGIVSVRDILGMLSGPSVDLTTRVHDVMTRDVLTVGPETSLREVERLIVSRRVHHIPVVEDGRLVGIVTLADILGHLLEHVTHSHSELLRYVAHSAYPG